MTADGRFKVEKDQTPHITVEEREGSGVLCGMANDGWCLIVDEQVFDWFDRKSDAVAAAAALERRKK